MVKVFGHQGAVVGGRRNTVEAFLEAKRLGADGVELDVRRTADGGLAIHHDAALPDPDGRRLLDLTVAELPEWLPLLDAALTACEGMEVNIELKNSPADIDHDPDDMVAGRVAQLVAEMGWRQRVIVSSFNPVTVGRVHAADPSIPTGWLTPRAIDPFAAVEQAASAGHVAIHPHFRAVTEELVQAAHDAGLAVNTWTIDDPAVMQRVAAYGVDVIITNVPAIALEALSSFRA